MRSLFTLLELIYATLAEMKTRKANRNFTIPSSQTGKDESAFGLEE